MKKSIYLLIVALSLGACRQEPDLSELSNDFMVFTNRDTSAQFTQLDTYYMPDSVMVIGDSSKATYWTGTQAEPILNAYASNLQTFGYTRTTDKSAADVGIQISYLKSVVYFQNYYNSYWWNDYPGYWSPLYWGGWSGWYYPYPVVYSYRVGSLLTDMVDLTDTTSSKLTVVWQSFLSGLLSSSSTYNTERTVQAINQSFTQSPYLKQ